MKRWRFSLRNVPGATALRNTVGRLSRSGARDNNNNHCARFESASGVRRAAERGSLYSAEVLVKQCPFCMGEIPDAAAKCQHCGEWVDGRARQTGDLGRAANRYVSFSIIMGAVVVVLILLFFFLFWLPNWNKMQSDFDKFPNMPTSQK